MNYDWVEQQRKARERANLPIDRKPLVWAVLGLTVAIIGIVVMQVNVGVGLATILGGVIVTTIITSWWFNEMSLRNLGRGLKALDELEVIARQPPPIAPPPSPQEKPEPQVPDTHPPR
jgi:Flp pilus assembly protein TadB